MWAGSSAREKLNLEKLEVRRLTQTSGPTQARTCGTHGRTLRGCVSTEKVAQPKCFILWMFWGLQAWETACQLEGTTEETVNVKVKSCHIHAQKNLLASYCIWTFLKRPYKAIQCSRCAVGSAFRIDIFGEGRKQGGVEGDLKPQCRFNQQQLRPTRIVDNSLWGWSMLL